MEWDYRCGLVLEQMYPLQEGIEDFFEDKSYGELIKKVTMLIICRPYDFSQRKSYRKKL